MAYLQTLSNINVLHSSLSGLGNDDHTQYHTDARALAWLGTRSTDDLPEGANLYYTEVRVSANADVSANTTHRSDTTNPHVTTLNQVVSEDADTDVTGSELEELTDGSETTLHEHAAVNISYDNSGNNVSLGIQLQIALDNLETRLYAQETEVISHSDLDDLANDDHTQYHTDARGDARYYTKTQLDAGQLDNRYYTETEIDNLLNLQNEAAEISFDPSGNSFTGTDVQSALENAASRLDTAESDIATYSDHGNLTGLGDDDHTQYHNDTRGDARYYTKTELDAGQLDNRYYTEAEIDTLLSQQDEAAEIGFNPATNSFTDTDVQSVLEDAAGRLDANEGNISTLQTDLNTAESDITNLETDVSTLNDHIDGTASKHDASEIDVEGSLDSAASAPTDLETVLGEVDDEITKNRFYRIVEPSEGTSGIRDAIDAAHTAGGGIVQLKAGTYTMDATIELPQDCCNVTVQGVGKTTILEHDGTTSRLITTDSFVTNNISLDNMTAGDTSVTTSTASHAGSFSAGDIIAFRGTDDNSQEESEHNIVVSANATTGVIELEKTITNTMTSCSAWQEKGTKYCTFKDFFVSTTASSNVTVDMMNFDGSAFLNLENLHIDGNNYINKGIVFYGNRNVLNKITNCTIFGFRGLGIALRYVYDTTIENCKIVSCGTANTNSHGIGIERGVYNTTINNSFIEGSTGNGIDCGNNSAKNRRANISNNTIRYCQNGMTICSEFKVHGNLIEGCIANGITTENNAINSRFVITSNTIRGCEQGVVILFTENVGAVISNNTFHNCSDRAMTITGDKAIVTGNYIDDIGTRGIVLDSDDTIVSNNIITNSPTDSIFLSNSCSGCIISFNILGGNGISEGSGANTFIGNKD